MSLDCARRLWHKCYIWWTILLPFHVFLQKAITVDGCREEGYFPIFDMLFWNLFKKLIGENAYWKGEGEIARISYDRSSLIFFTHIAQSLALSSRMKGEKGILQIRVGIKRERERGERSGKSI